MVARLPMRGTFRTPLGGHVMMAAGDENSYSLFVGVIVVCVRCDTTII
jgi:hypothetical protein